MKPSRCIAAGRKVFFSVAGSVPVIATLALPPAAYSADYYAKRSNWDTRTGGMLHISGFVFRDLNRNGVYDLGDRPMAAVAVLCTGHGRIVTTRTNSGGFANFNMSALNTDADIVKPGDYSFKTIVPDGWLLTTGNAEQQSTFQAVPGTPADMVSSTPQKPVGLAQKLVIRGRIAKRYAPPDAPETTSAANSAIRVRAISANGGEQDALVEPTGSFSFGVTPGRWKIVASESNGAASEREVDVSTAPVQLAALVPGGRMRNDAHADRKQTVTVTFDDMVSTGVVEIPDGYDGLNWHNFVAAHDKFYGGAGYVNTTMSGEFVAYNGSGHPVEIDRKRPFDFVGGYFGVAWPHAEGETLQIRAWRNDALAYKEQITLSALGPVYFSADFEDITRLQFRTSHYWQFVTDNLSFRMTH